jgi:hypothetical protein
VCIAPLFPSFPLIFLNCQWDPRHPDHLIADHACVDHLDQEVRVETGHAMPTTTNIVAVAGTTAATTLATTAASSGARAALALPPAPAPTLAIFVFVYVCVHIDTDALHRGDGR